MFSSEDYAAKDVLVCLIHGSGVVRAGQWARRLIINNDFGRVLTSAYDLFSLFTKRHLMKVLDKKISFSVSDIYNIHDTFVRSINLNGLPEGVRYTRYYDLFEAFLTSTAYQMCIHTCGRCSD